MSSLYPGFSSQFLIALLALYTWLLSVSAVQFPVENNSDVFLRWQYRNMAVSLRLGSGSKLVTNLVRVGLSRNIFVQKFTIFHEPATVSN